MRIAAALVAGLLMLTGCTAPGPRVVTDSGTYAVVAGPSDIAMDAGISATVVVDEHDCWAVEVADLGTHPVMWPAGTEVDDGALVVPRFEDSRIVPGTRIVGGGGELTSSSDYEPCWTQGELYWQMAPGSLAHASMANG